MGRRAVIAFAVVALVFVATGCKRDITKEVLFVNDSVTHQSLGAIVTEFNNVEQANHAGRYAPNFASSVPGIGLKQVLPVPAAEIPAYWANHMASLIEHTKPEVIVVELGYNDCGYDLTNYSADIDNLMANIPPSVPVHWLTMQDAKHLFTCDELINGALAAATTRWPNLTLFDFGAFVEGHTEWLADGKHLNADGQVAYANWLHDRLDEIYDPTATTTTSSSTTTTTLPPEPPPGP
jgi:hypothetical protein